MATVIEGQQYALSSQLSHSMNKSLIFVKLTDSALKAIEDYLNNKGNVCSNSKPSIEFRSNDSQGVISIPFKSSNVDEDKQRFNFTLSNVDAVEPQGSFECVRQSKNKNMESFGNMIYKMQIHANDDSYQKTKVKMAVVEQESKKNSTKVIKASDPNVGRKVKVKRQIGSRFGSHHHNQSLPSQLQPGYQKPNSPPALKVNGTNVNSVNSIPVTKNSVNNNFINHNNINNSFNSSTNPEYSKKSLRENILHILAVKPYKKSELILRLSNEGFKDVDRKELQSLLNSISTVKDNNYILSKTAWSEVHIDWNNYSNEEKELVKRRNPLIPMATHSEPQTHTQNGISPLSDCGSMQASPSPHSMDCTSPKSPAIIINKRSAESSQPVAKKKLCSVTPHQSFSNNNNNINNNKSPSNKLQTNGYHDVLNGWAKKPKSPEREPSHRAGGLLPNINDSRAMAMDSSNNGSNSPPDVNALCLPHQTFQPYQNNHNRVNYINNDNNYVKKNPRDAYSRYNSNGFHLNNNGSGSINSSPNSSPDSGTGSHDGSTLSSTNSYMCTNDETPDYLSKYVKITNNDQRDQYRKDFYFEYEEYKRLHKYLESVATKFTDLENRLNMKIEGSDEWNNLMEQIVREYEETKSCPKFLKARKRMFYLHDKLAHIKNIVHDYDKNYHKDKHRMSHKLYQKSVQYS